MARRVLVRALLLSVCASFCGATALAADGENCFTYGATLPQTEIPGGDGVYGTFPATSFDPALGPLQSVEVATSTDFAGTVGIENTSETLGHTYHLMVTWYLELLRPDDSTFLHSEATRNVTGFLDPFDGTIDFGGFSGQTFTLSQADILGDAMTADPAELDWFKGVGTFDFKYHAWYELSLIGSGFDPFDGPFETSASNVTVSSDVQITYCIPEPGALVLLLTAVPIVLRRR